MGRVKDHFHDEIEAMHRGAENEPYTPEDMDEGLGLVDPSKVKFTRVVLCDSKNGPALDISILDNRVTITLAEGVTMDEAAVALFDALQVLITPAETKPGIFARAWASWTRFKNSVLDGVAAKKIALEKEAAQESLARDAAAVWGTSQRFQDRVLEWVLKCFSDDSAYNVSERNYRFLEEALELVQAGGCTRDEAISLVDYVYGRPIGEVRQEVGGVMLTLSALCSAHKVDMRHEGRVELARVWGKIETIRAKQASKPKGQPLPGKR